MLSILPEQTHRVCVAHTQVAAACLLGMMFLKLNTVQKNY